MKISDKENIIQSKTLDILASFNKKEFQQFGKQLDSAVVSNKNLKKLYSFLRKFYPAFDNKNLTKIRLHKAVYGDHTAYSELNTRKLLSDLYKEAEKFLVMFHLKTNKIVYDKILMEEFDMRRLDSLFYSKYEELGRYMDEENAYPYRYIEKHIIEWFYVSFHLERGMQQKIAPNVYKRAEYIIFYFLSDLFITLQDMAVNRDKYNYTDENNIAETFILSLDTEKIFSYIEKHFPENIVLKLFYGSYLALKHVDDEKYYFELKKLTKKHFKSLHETGKRGITAFLINYCRGKFTSPNSFKFEMELNEHYKTYIDNVLYKITGENYLRIDLFLSILQNFFNTGKLNEAAEFLNKNIQIIMPAHRKNMLALCNALIDFERSDYSSSLKHAAQIKSNTQLYKEILKVLILKNYFELNMTDLAAESSLNFRKSLEKNEKLNQANKELYFNFIRFYRSILKLNSYNKEELHRLKKELVGEKSAEQKWLIRKIEEHEGIY